MLVWSLETCEVLWYVSWWITVSVATGEIVAMFVREGEVFRAHNWLKSQTDVVPKGLFRRPKGDCSEQPCFCRGRASGLAVRLCGHALSLQLQLDLLAHPSNLLPMFLWLTAHSWILLK